MYELALEHLDKMLTSRNKKFIKKNKNNNLEKDNYNSINDNNNEYVAIMNQSSPIKVFVTNITGAKHVVAAKQIRKKLFSENFSTKKQKRAPEIHVLENKSRKNIEQLILE